MTKADLVSSVAQSTGIEKATIMIPESDVPSFKPAKEFKAAMKK